MQIVGLDCSTDPKKTGLARSTWNAGLRIHTARRAQSRADVVDTIVKWLSAEPSGVLAVDAPLGWPVPLTEALHSHCAGDPLPMGAHSLFRRETDRAIKQRLGKQSLDVGADRIARTAHAALSILAEIRAALPLVMGWTPGAVDCHQVIEVYPAATLKALGLPSSGYKGNTDSEAMRSRILEAMPQAEFAPDPRKNAVDCDDALDAAVCTLAGADYAVGNSVAPTNLALAKREGWIWVRV